MSGMLGHAGVMRTIGLIGGMSWHSTMTYYRLLNEAVAREYGGHSSAKIVLQSLDFAEIRQCQVDGDWERAATLLAAAGRHCQDGGADMVAICTNLMHKVAPSVEASLQVPLVHIADAVAAEADRNGWTRLGILGTKWTMQEDFYADRLARHGCHAVVPTDAECDLIDRIIFDELTRGVVRAESRAAYVRVIEGLAARGAQAVVLACTEIGMLLEPAQSPLPTIDSAEAHAAELARLAVAVTV